MPQAKSKPISNSFALKALNYFLIVSSLILPVRAQVTDNSGNFTWKPVKIGAGGFISGLALSPNDESGIFARTDVGNAYRYDGTSWKPLRVHNGNAGGSGVKSANDFGAPAKQGILSIAVDPSNSQNVYMAYPTAHSNDVLATTPNHGVDVYYSNDGGQNFYAGDLNVDGDPNDQTGNVRYAGERLGVDPNNGQVVYYGSSDAGIWRSVNGGVNYSQVSGGNAPGGDVINVLFYGGAGTTSAFGLPNQVSSTVYAVVLNGDVYQSQDAGQNWANISSGTGLSGKANFTTIDKQGSLYVSDGGSEYWVYSGGNWSEFTIPGLGTLENVVADPSNDPGDPGTNRLYAVSNGGDFFRSTDNGADWTGFGKFAFAPSSIGWLPQTVGSPSGTFKLTGGIRFDANGNLWAAEGNEGTLEYTPPARGSDTGDTPLWTIRSQGIEEFVATDLVVPPGSGDTVLAMVEDGTGFVVTNPDAFTATQIPLQQQLISEGAGVAYVPDNPASIFVSTGNVYGEGPNYSGYSFNTGQNWSLFGGSYTYPDGNPAQAGSIAVSTRGGVINSGNDHIVVTPIYNHIPEWSSDGGTSWNQTGSFPASSSDPSVLDPSYSTFANAGTHPNELQADPFTPDTFYLKLNYGPTDSNFYVSTNGGQTWTAQNVGLPQNVFHGVLATNRIVQGDLWFVDGWEGSTGNYAGTIPNHGLWHSAPDPSNPGVHNFTYVSGFDHAIQVALGAATPGGQQNYTVYVYGHRTDSAEYGVFRSTDGGNSFDRISYYPTGIYDWPTAMAASWDNAGKVYIGFSGNSFVYSQPGSGTTTPSSDTITSVSWPASVPAAGPATATVQYSANSGRTLTVYLWDSNYNWKGQTSQTVSGNGSATITVPANSSITTGVAYMRAILQNDSTTLSQLDNDNIPVGSTATDTISSVSWPASVPAAGPANATVQYSANSGRTLTVYLWDSNYNWKGQTSQTVSGNGSATITVPANSSITTGVAYMRAILQNGSTTLSQLDNDSIPIQ